jgi:uncharacterized membrane protein
VPGETLGMRVARWRLLTHRPPARLPGNLTRLDADGARAMFQTLITLMFAVHGLNRTGATVMELATFVAALPGIACPASFLFFIDHAARLLRPNHIVALVSDQGMDVIRSVNPREGAETRPAEDTEQSAPLGMPSPVVSQAGRSMIVLAVALDALVAKAARVNGVIEFVPQVGDFVHVAFTEIRACGANNVQIARRMRAMLGNLVRTLPESRHASRIRRGLVARRAVGPRPR